MKLLVSITLKGTSQGKDTKKLVSLNSNDFLIGTRYI